ncbi:MULTISPECIES: sensor histidine kinase [unclassified Rathayibacter]|uniref:sensor histidine kinase n=1 Tax=unclassified Rathayibacter TaxID=2609250 RepID=UPI00188AE6F5|nr:MULTISPECIES: histidine kinase [unclassified Rathayibacter]MBF4462235.1 sensor domain-containing protein [Rathayibacter sp. VKM Ac-2879]MBF4503722.1 sensor domain-containing protein [Rathayibacter sp. VKM Ac-2878]
MPSSPTALGEASRAYVRLWRELPREVLALALSVPVALVGALIVGLLLGLAVALVGVVIGLVFLPAALVASRWFSRVAVGLDRLAGRPAIARPRWRRPPASVAPAAFALYGPVLDGHYWLALLHTVVLAPLIAVVFGILLWLWGWAGIGTVVSAVDGTGANSGLASFLTAAARLVVDVPEPPPGLVVAATIAMTVLFVVTLPLLTRGLTLARYLVDRLLLGPWSSEALQREVAELSASRGAAVAAEDRALRQLERDIHDGPQQRLLRVQMDLGSARARLERDPASAAVLLEEARDHVREALDELRALSRGVAPPILQDRGFEAALRSLAALSATPVELLVEHPVVGVPPEVERSVYFVVAELLANASKHAEARSIWVHVDVRDAPAGERWLDTWVIDDGVGGAVALDGHGIEGVNGRVSGLRGVFTLQSPPGGPTTAGVHVPFRPLAVS